MASSDSWDVTVRIKGAPGSEALISDVPGPDAASAGLVALDWYWAETDVQRRDGDELEVVSAVPAK